MNQAELRNHLAEQMGVRGVGQALSAEDAEFIDTVLENGHGELEQRGVALWTLDDVPDYAIESIVRYCSPACAPRFGKTDEFPMSDRIFALAELRELTSDSRTSVGKADYF